jgi:hypothetical protein
VIDLNKQYTLVGNRGIKVKLSHIDGNIVYGYYHTDDDWQSCKWNLVDGVCIGEVVRSRFHDSSYNLIEPKIKICKNIWISIYPNGAMIVHTNNFLETYKQSRPLDTINLQVEFNV